MESKTTPTENQTSNENYSGKTGNENYSGKTGNEKKSYVENTQAQKEADNNSSKSHDLNASFKKDNKDANTEINMPAGGTDSKSDMEDDTETEANAETSDVSTQSHQNLPEPQKSNIIAMSFNFMNSIVGVAMTGIPYAFRESGFGLGILMLIVFAIMSKYSLEILIAAGKAVDARTYQDLVRIQYGNLAYYYLTFIQTLYPFILLIIYNMLIGDSFLEVLADALSIPESQWYIYRPLVILACNVCVCLPISLLYDIRRLSEVSLMSLIFVVMMVAIMTTEVAMKPHIPETDHAYQFANSGIIEALGIIAVAFISHHSAFLLYEQLDEPTLERWNTSATISTFSSFGMISFFGIAGFIKFTGHSHSNIFKNFCKNDEWADFAKVCFAVSLMLSYPIQVFVTREVIDNALFFDRDWTLLRHVVTTLTIGILAYIISTVAFCLKSILELTGVFGAFPLAYVLPTVLYMKTTQQRGISKENFQIVLMGFVGVLITIIGTIKIVLDIVDEKHCNDKFVPTYCNKTES